MARKPGVEGEQRLMKPRVIGFVAIWALQIGAGEPSGTISTVVGTGEKGYSGDGGPARAARLNNPFDVTFDSAGNLFLSDTFNHVVRRVDARTGVITTVAGAGRPGFDGDGGPATEAHMNEPYGIVVDRRGNLYIADRLNRRVRRVDGKTGTMSTLTGDGSKTGSGDAGPAVKAGLNEPNGLALNPSETLLYIADVADNRVRSVDLGTGIISTFAGDGRAQHRGDGGPARQASIAGARAVDVGSVGTVYLVERQGNRVRAIDPQGEKIITVAGTGAKGYSGDGGPALEATFNGPKEIAADRLGHLFVVDTENHAIRRSQPNSGSVTTVAGAGTKGPGGDGGPGPRAQLARPHGVAVGPDGAIYIGDTENHRIRKVTP